MAEKVNGKQSYGLMDIIKFIMAFLVVTIHRRLGSDESFFVFEEVNTIARFAVPFFFACSAFLLFSRYDSSEAVFKFAKKNLRIYIIWFLIYLPFTIFKYVYSFGYGISEIIKALVLDNLRYPIQLWFLPSLAISAVCVYYLTKNKEIIGAIAAITLAIASVIYSIINPQAEILSNSYISLIKSTLFIGIPYVYIGYFLGRHSVKIKKSSAILIFITSVVASLIWGAVEFQKGVSLFYETKLTYIPAIFFLMVLCINYSPNKSYIKIRKASMLFYYTHLLMYQEILYILLDMAGLSSLIQNRLAIFFITIVYTTIITVLILLLENKKGFKWLKKLYN